jgi:hypothetical protein
LARMMTVTAVIAVASSTALAGLLPVSVTVNPESNNFRWTYAIVLPTDMKLQPGNYFTIYDFEGYIPGGEAQPTDWVFSASKVGPTPDRLKPIDNQDTWNLSWKYTGDTIPTGQLGLGNFWAISSLSEEKSSSFTATTNRTSDGLRDNNITDTVTPVGTTTPPPGVPEPGTLALAALGLPMIGLAGYWKKAKTKKDVA